MNLEELKKLCDGATPGAWTSLSDRVQQKQIKDNQSIGAVIIDQDARREDLRFIAATREYMPKLIAVAVAAGELFEDCAIHPKDYADPARKLHEALGELEK